MSVQREKKHLLSLLFSVLSVGASFFSIPTVALADISWLDDASDCGDFRLRLRVYSEVASDLGEFSTISDNDVDRAYAIACSARLAMCNFRFCADNQNELNVTAEADLGLEEIVTQSSYLTLKEAYEEQTKLQEQLIAKQVEIENADGLEWERFTISERTMARRNLSVQISEMQKRNSIFVDVAESSALGVAWVSNLLKKAATGLVSWRATTVMVGTTGITSFRARRADVKP